MLDPGGDEVARDALAQEAKARIEAGGTLKHESDWGLRKMAYEIAQRNEADYRWFRFEGSAELLDGLNHSLRIADGVLRFRIFKVDADTPTIAPAAAAAPGAGAARERPAAADAPEPEGDASEQGPEAEAREPAAEVAAETAEPAAADAAVAEEGAPVVAEEPAPAAPPAAEEPAAAATPEAAPAAEEGGGAGEAEPPAGDE